MTDLVKHHIDHDWETCVDCINARNRILKLEEKLKTQNELLRIAKEALAFYANSVVTFHMPDAIDSGQKAREALAKIDEVLK
jgi:ABC-type uncharacterized transport system YnjBCD ATPase subunit